MENSSYFSSRHKLSAFFALIFRYSSCHHSLLASALAKMMQDEGNRVVIGKDENAVRQLISMISSENHHVVSSVAIFIIYLYFFLVISCIMYICTTLCYIYRLSKRVLHLPLLPRMYLYHFS